MNSHKVNHKIHNKFITKTNTLMGSLASVGSCSENYEISSISRHVHDILNMLIKQTNKISKLEKEVKRLKKVNQQPYHKSHLLTRISH